MVRRNDRRHAVRRPAFADDALDRAMLAERMWRDGEHEARPAIAELGL